MTSEKDSGISCTLCGKVENMPFKCNFCKEQFCIEHRNPINHSCPFVNEYKKKRQNMIFNKKYGSNYSTMQILSNIIRIKTSKTELIHLNIAKVLVTAVKL